MRTPLLLASLALSFQTLNAQGLTGAQQQPTHGYSFIIPDGWVGEAQDGSYALASETVTGMILIGPTTYATAEGMWNELAAATEDGAGTSMRATEGPTDLGNNTVFVAHAGTLEGVPMKVVAIGRWNPGGKTVTVAGLAPPEAFSKELLAALKLVQTSVQYITSTPTTATAAKTTPSTTTATPDGPVDTFWKDRLSGNRLTYMDSYSSPASYPGGMSGGYSVTRKIDLCPQGFFTTNGNSDHNFGGDGVSGYGSSSSAGEGTWSAIRGENGRSLLRLRFNDGSVRDYLLDNRDGSTYLNNERWYRTNKERDGAEYAPNCP
jgi:hypothetical protein